MPPNTTATNRVTRKILALPLLAYTDVSPAPSCACSCARPFVLVLLRVIVIVIEKIVGRSVTYRATQRKRPRRRPSTHCPYERRRETKPAGPGRSARPCCENLQETAIGANKPVGNKIVFD